MGAWADTSTKEMPTENTTEDVMEEIRLKRNGKEDLVFNGQEIVVIDDRELIGVTPNWWELALFKTSFGKYILSSTFHINYPHRQTMCGAICFKNALDVKDYLVNECNGPSMIADALLTKAARRDSSFRTGPKPDSVPPAIELLSRDQAAANVA